MRFFAFLLITMARLVATLPAADTPEAIATDYRAKASLALEKVNMTLEKATVPIIADLVKAGDTVGAEEVKTQLKAKQEGQPVLTPHAKVANLFTLYDAARLKALEPAQKSAIARIEALLASSSGKKLEVVESLGKIRAEVVMGTVVDEPAPPPRNYLRKNKIPTRWGYYLSVRYDKRYGTVILKEDGTISIETASPGVGTWTVTDNPTILSVEIRNADNSPEKTQMAIQGNEAVMKRKSGIRYLKAD